MTTHGPIDPNYAKAMKDLARWIDEYWNGNAKGPDRTVGFCLLVFPFGGANPHRDRINYLSNAERKDMVIALKELVARFDGHDHKTPVAPQ